MIKFFNINRQDKSIKKDIIRNIKKVITKNNFILGDYVEQFEKSFSSLCKSKYAIGCANGTDALTIALKILNLPRRSEVIIPAMTYCSTAFAVINAVLGGVLALIWGERRLLGRFQHRTGPNRWGPQGILTSTADAVKVMFKEDIIPEEADKYIFNF